MTPTVKTFTAHAIITAVVGFAILIGIDRLGRESVPPEAAARSLALVGLGETPATIAAGSAISPELAAAAITAPPGATVVEIKGGSLGSGSATVLLPPPGSFPDVVEKPAEVIRTVRDAGEVGWVAVFVVLGQVSAMLLMRAKGKIKWLGTGWRPFVVGIIIAAGLGAYDALWMGGSGTALLFAVGFAVALEVQKAFFSGPPASSSTTTTATVTTTTTGNDPPTLPAALAAAPAVPDPDHVTTKRLTAEDPDAILAREAAAAERAGVK